MFDLEKQISEWRRQMLASGITFPVPLEELELHLREEIERQIELGLREQKAFETAAAQLGQAGILKKEFTKTKSLFDLIGGSKRIRINRVLGALWLAQSLWSLITLLPVFGEIFFIPAPKIRLTAGFLYLIIAMAICVAAMVGSMYLFFGAKLGRSIIRIIASVGIIECVAQIFVFKSLSIWGGVSAAFCLISIWLLRLPKDTDSKITAK